MSASLNADEEIARQERIVLALLRAFEGLAARKYEEHAPDLLVPDKAPVLASLAALSPDDAVLATSALGGPAAALLEAADGDRERTLLVQGLILEQLAQLIYERVGETEGVSAAVRELGASGAAASRAVLERSPDVIAAELGEGPALFEAFTRATGQVLSRLDALGEAVDHELGAAFGLSFADVMGDLTAELLPTCIGLGMERRPLMMYLTSCLMNAS